MHTPLPGRTRAHRNRRSAATALAIALTCLGIAPATHAESLLGVTTAYDTEPSELAASALLATARQDLADNRGEPARRALEVLIARYPDSTSAAFARRELFALYAIDAAVTGPPPAPVIGASTTSTFEREANRSALPPSDAATGWRTSVVSFRRLQDEFRNSIGDRIFFSAASDELGSRARTVLAAQAEWLVRRPQIEIVVEGHADDAMAGADNAAVSRQRARAVRDRLIEEGVDADRIVLAAKSNGDPIALCSDSDCAAQNRRAVLVVGLRRTETGTGTPLVPAVRN